MIFSGGAAYFTITDAPGLKSGRFPGAVNGFLLSLAQRGHRPLSFEGEGVLRSTPPPLVRDGDKGGGGVKILRG